MLILLTGQKLQGIMKRESGINVVFETELEGRENVMTEMFVFLKAFSILASGVRILISYYNRS